MTSKIVTNGGKIQKYDFSHLAQIVHPHCNHPASNGDFAHFLDSFTDPPDFENDQFFVMRQNTFAHDGFEKTRYNFLVSKVDPTIQHFVIELKDGPRRAMYIYSLIDGETSFKGVTTHDDDKELHKFRNHAAAADKFVPTASHEEFDVAL